MDAIPSSEIRILALGFALTLALAATATATTTTTSECPAGWDVRPGVCLWPRQQAYRNVTVAGGGPHAEAQACCAECASETRCVSWLVYTAAHDKDPARTCILNAHPVEGQAPPDPACTSGLRPVPPPTPPPTPAKKGAKNVRTPWSHSQRFHILTAHSLDHMSAGKRRHPHRN